MSNFGQRVQRRRYFETRPLHERVREQHDQMEQFFRRRRGE